MSDYNGDFTKCAAVNIKRSEITQEQAQMPISHTEFIPSLQNSDHYKFFRKQENATHLEDIVMQEVSKEYLRCRAVIWSSPLTIPRIIANKSRQDKMLRPLYYHFPVDKYEFEESEVKKPWYQ